MTVDPADDCTFWYTNEYYSANATTDWKTKIGKFVIPECLDPMPAFSTAPTAIDFGYGAVGASSPPRTLTVTNTGQPTADLTISSVALSGGNSGDFGIQNDTCSGESLGAGETCTVQATFTPTGAGARATALRFTDDAAGSPHDIALTGSGTVAQPPTTGPTGERAAALKKCKKKRSAKARKRCRKRAKKLPV
jgi:hypothetical protein